MKLKDMMYVALFAAVTAALGLLPPIPLPFTPVPITSQTLGVMLAGAILGARLGSLSLLLFVFLVAVGAPVLTGGRGGLPIILGPSGGYILSWPIAAFVIGFLVERFWSRLNVWKVFVFNILGGMIVIYAAGIPYQAFVTDLPLQATALSAVAYLPGDLLKALIAALVAVKIKQVRPFIQPRMANRSSSQ
ncbi:biotin transport system substrate-specific component [Caldalkalibacillus uzonensis]|uniref:Biotin transporter n=1 Tax=Caldalkalibacillus uzonensis TaxID=353224 RepID=A0ABU0CUX6_9BACI|nr:biotin transporter BioY [Caldalkalibacillus uzonensis]MDQ0339330.1 biotin transport system substrate-specific component [Caldalkalibacillus uzonensis]